MDDWNPDRGPAYKGQGVTRTESRLLRGFLDANAGVRKCRGDVCPVRVRRGGTFANGPRPTGPGRGCSAPTSTSATIRRLATRPHGQFRLAVRFDVRASGPTVGTTDGTHGAMHQFWRPYVRQTERGNEQCLTPYWNGCATRDPNRFPHHGCHPRPGRRGPRPSRRRTLGYCRGVSTEDRGTRRTGSRAAGRGMRTCATPTPSAPPNVAGVPARRRPTGRRADARDFPCSSPGGFVVDLLRARSIALDRTAAS